MKNKEAQPITRNIAKKGFSGMRSSSPASISLYLDSNVLRIPFQAILPTLCTRGGDKSQRPDKKGIDIKPRQNRNK